MSSQSLYLHIFLAWNCGRLFVQYLWMEGTVFELLVFTLSPVLRYPLLLLLQFLFQLSRVVLLGGTVCHRIGGWYVLIFTVLGNLRLECAVVEFLSHQLLLNLWLAFLTLGVVGEFIDRLAAAGYCLRDLVDLGFVSVLGVDLFFNQLSYYLLLLLIFIVESMYAILVILTASNWVTLTYDFWSRINLWMVRIALLVRPLPF